MEFTRIAVTDNVKVQFDSVAVLQRKGSSTAAATSMSVSAAGAASSSPGGPDRGGSSVHGGGFEVAAGSSYFVYVGSNDGYITQYACTIAAAAASAGLTVTTTLAQRRRVLEGGDGSVPTIAVDESFREARLIVLNSGRVSLLNSNSLDPFPCFQGVKSLDGAVACCVAQGPQGDAHRLAAVVKKQLVTVEFTETQCVPYPAPGSAGTGEKRGGSAAAAAASVNDGFAAADGSTTSSAASLVTVPDGVSQMAWVGNIIIMGSKREYVLIDARSFRVVDHVVVEKMPLGPAIRFLPDYDGGHVAIRHGDAGMVLYDPFSKIPQPVDANNRAPFPEPIADLGHCGSFLVGLKSNGSVLLCSIVDQKVVAPVGGVAMTFGTLCRQHSNSGPFFFAAVTNQSVGCLVPRPIDHFVADFVSVGDYERALIHYEQAFRNLIEQAQGPTASQDESRYYEGLRRVRHACAVHAFTRSNRFAEAFNFFEAAEIPPEHIVRAVPQLRRPRSAGNADDEPSSSSTGSTGSTSWMIIPLRRDAIESREVWALVYQYIKRHRYPVTASDVLAWVPTAAQRDVDYAIFWLLLHGHVPFSDEALNQLFLPATALEPSVCLPLVEARFSSSSDGYGGGSADAADVASNRVVPSHASSSPQKASFTSLLLAADGRFQEALTQCRLKQLVAEAVVPLQLSGDPALYAEHMPWMLQCSPSTAINALTCPSPAGRPHPAVDVMLPLILPHGGETLIRYLEHCIFSARCRDPAVHTLHATNFIDTIVELRGYGVASLMRSTAAAGVPPGSEAGLLGSVRWRLLHFLTHTSLYDADTVTCRLLQAGGLEHELVAAYRRSGEHDLALHTLVYQIGDHNAAVQYCDDVHVSRPECGWRVWRRPEMGDEAIDLASGTDAEGKRGQTLTTPLSNVSFGNESVLSGSDEGSCTTPAVLRDRGGRLSSSSNLLSNSANQSFIGGGAHHVQMPRALVPSSSITNHPLFAPPSNAMEPDPPIAMPNTSDGNRAGSEHAAVAFNDYLIVLLRVLLLPPKGFTPRVASALELLKVHAHEINPLTVIEALPGDVAFSEIADYLVDTLHNNARAAFTASIAAAARTSEWLSATQERALLTQRSVYVDEDRPCAVCRKRVGDAVIGVFPNLKVAHFRCFKDKDRDPERGTLFFVPDAAL